MDITLPTRVLVGESIFTVFLPVLDRDLQQELTQNRNQDKKHLHWDPRENVSV